MNLNPTVISQSKEEEEDRSFWKVIIIALLGAASVFASFFLFNKFLIEGSLVRLLGSAVFAVLFFALFILQIFFVKSRVRIGFLTLLQAAAPIFVFYSKIFPEPSFALIAGFAVFFIFLTSAAFRGQKEIANVLKIKFFSITKSILPRAVSGFLIVFSLLLYLTYFVWGGFNENFAQKLVSQTLASGEPIFKLVLTDASFESSTDEFLKKITESQLNKIKVDRSGVSGAEPVLEFWRLPPAEKEKLISETAKELKKKFEKTVGPLNGNVPVNEEVYRIIKEYVDSLSPAAKSALSVIVAVLFFFFARGVVYFFYWVPGVISFILFKFLLVSGFVYINLESRNREFIMLS